MSRCTPTSGNEGSIVDRVETILAIQNMSSTSRRQTILVPTRMWLAVYEITVIAERVQYYDRDGKLITESLKDYAATNGHIEVHNAR